MAKMIKVELTTESLIREVLNFNFSSIIKTPEFKQNRDNLTAKLAVFFAHIIRQQHKLETNGDFVEEIMLSIDDYVQNDYAGAFNIETLEVNLENDFLASKKIGLYSIETLAHELTHRAQYFYKVPDDLMFSSHSHFMENFTRELMTKQMEKYAKENNLTLNEKEIVKILKNCRNAELLLSPAISQEMHKTYAVARKIFNAQSLFMLDYWQAPSESEARHNATYLVDILIKKAIEMASAGKLNANERKRLDELCIEQQFLKSRETDLDGFIAERKNYSTTMEYFKSKHNDIYLNIQKLRSAYLQEILNKKEEFTSVKYVMPSYQFDESTILGIAESFVFNFNQEEFDEYLNFLDELSCANSENVRGTAFSAYLAILTEPDIKMGKDTFLNIKNNLLTIFELSSEDVNAEEIFDYIRSYREQFKFINNHSNENIK